MAARPNRISLALARSLHPLSELTAENLQEVMDKASVQEVQAGRILFKRGARDNKSFYLLSGEVVLAAEGASPVLIAAGSRAARQPLDAHQPRRATATARSKLTLMVVDNDLLDVLLGWEQDAGYVVTELETDAPENEHGDWMTQILRSRIFQRIPPANLQALFAAMEPVQVRAGEVVVQQGRDGDYYYFIHRGGARVTRLEADGQEIPLADLQAGDAFGEEALIANQKRNASVVMSEDGQLLRLSKTAFEHLLKEPALSTVDFPRAAELVRGGAQLLDVRHAAEYAKARLRGSVNIPLTQLRAQAAKLDPKRSYVVYCDSGGRSASAAYLLSAEGLNVYVLDGGLRRLAEMKKAAHANRSAT